MLKYLIPAVFCLLASLSACEPNVSEPMEPVSKTPPNTSIGEDEHLPSDPPMTLDSTMRLALAEINAWRQKGCKCGDDYLAATDEVAWNGKLYAAALAHAKDMYAKNYFSHTSPSGENVYHRLVGSGYISTSSSVLSYGENIAFGDFDVKLVVQKWLESPSHCANIMRDSYREMAIAHEGNYWVQVFGARRE